MSEIPLYKIFRAGPSAGIWTLSTLLDGPAAGSQLLLQDGRPVWQTGDAAALLQNVRVLGGCTAAGICPVGDSHAFVERFGAVPQLVVCGGGHVGVSVVQLAKLLGMPVTAMEDRPEYADDLRSAGADTVLCQPFEQGLADFRRTGVLFCSGHPCPQL